MLNNKKEIIAKRLDFEQIEKMLKHLLGLTDEEDKKDNDEENTE
jgi:hypothetical protein